MRRPGYRSAFFALLPALIGVFSCSEPTAVGDARGPVTVQIVSGDAQRGVIGRELPQPLIVKVTDEKGKVVKDQLVNFVVVSGGGSVFAGSAISDKQGIAREFWTLGMSLAAGSNVLEVRAVDEKGDKRVYARFTATGTPIPVGSIVLSSSSVTIEEGEIVQITAKLYDDLGKELDPTGRQVQWLSSNSGIVQNQGGGHFLGVTPGGPVAVTATLEGKTASAMVTVVRAVVAYVEIVPNYLTLEVGGGYTLLAIPHGTRGQMIFGRTATWTNLDPAILELVPVGSDRATVKGLAAGFGGVRAEVEGYSYSMGIYVSRPAVGSIEVSPNPVSLRVGESVDLTATVRDIRGNLVTDCSVTWLAPYFSGAQVVSTGQTTATVTGQFASSAATITASCEGVSRQVEVLVTRVPVGSITLTPSNSNLTIGQSVLLTAVVRDINGTIVTDRVVTWTSTNPNAVTLSMVNGLTSTATAIADGTASINVSSEGVIQTATIVAKPVAVASVEVEGVNAYGIGETFWFGAILRDADGNRLFGRTVTWSLSNASPAGLATLEMASNGNAGVTAIIDGTVNVVATSEGVTGSRPITINPFYDPFDTDIAAAPFYMGAVTPGSSRTYSALFGRNADQSDWYLATATDGNGCTSGTKTLTLHVTLTGIPVGRNFDVFVYNTPGGPLVASATTSGNVAEAFDVSKTGSCGTNLTFDAYIEVRRVSGTPSNSPYTLGVSVP